ncbi:hypothetical protein CCR75_002018 [Bremia lactucae]|uniref:Uncharacterized protein n=1 Tax=Bremia lactucae TaxID=4779 RepID=A0A976FEU0_BRELC|nr:hypothetical protein CCR75_002018 [Bremia lactucae]
MEAPNDKLKQPLVDPEMKAVSPRSLNSGAIFVLHNSSVDRDADEEKEEAHRRQGNRPQKHKFQYTAPNVHPYAVPQYDPQGYGGGPANVWGGDQKMENGEQGSMVDIVFSGMYTLAAALTIIQGFGMLIHFTFAAVSLGLYTMAFGIC